MTKATNKTTSIKLLEGAQAIESAINSIKARGSKLQKDIHQAAVSTVAHMEKCGDYTLAVRLIEAMPASARKNALKQWFETYSFMTYDVEAKKWVKDKAKVNRVQEGMENPFWEKPAQEGVAYQPFDVASALETLLKRIDRAKAKGDYIAPEIVAKLEQVREEAKAPVDPLAVAA